MSQSQEPGIQLRKQTFEAVLMECCLARNAFLSSITTMHERSNGRGFMSSDRRLTHRQISAQGF